MAGMPERLKIYVASPISNGGKANPEERLENVRLAIALFLRLVDMGLAPVLPALTEYVEIVSGQRLPHATWMAIDLPWVRSCDALFRMAGESTGADIEVAEAKRCSIPVFYTVDELWEWACIERALAPVDDIPCDSLAAK